MKTQHTPGPWTYRLNPETDKRGFYSWWIDSAIENGHTPIADIRNIGLPSLANARLIAAAPDMLEALQELITDYEYCWDHPGDIMTSSSWIKAQHALTKATGKEE